MPIFCLHEHELKPNVNVQEYERSLANAIETMCIPGLLKAHHLKGFKGERANHYAVLWVFENKEAITENFGTLDAPKWPADWLYYENEILAQFLTTHPDKIKFTDYTVINDTAA